MGLFDSLAKQALGSILGGSDKLGGLDLGALMSLAGDPSRAQEALSGLLNQTGGLSGLMDRFQQAGLGDTVASWVGTGENAPLSAADLETALGSETLQGFASKLGFDGNQLMPLLAQFLPQIVDQLTPNGRIEPGAPSMDMLQNAVSGVMKNVFGGRA